MGNQPGKHQNYNNHGGNKPKKFVHWKTAEHPSPPGRPQLIPLSDQQPDIINLKWDRPQSDGGSPILGYIVEHRRMGSPHWVRATPILVTRCEVSISGLEPGWRYQFRAIAENVVGKSEPSELSDALTVTLQRNAITVPRFISELKDTNAVENDRVELRVSILGQPQPEISWFKDGFEIFSSRRTKIVNENEMSILIIHQVALTDEGEIKCTATNRAGHVVTRAKLKVEAPPKIRLPRNYEDGLIVEAEEVLRLKVGIGGQPQPKVIWLHEGDIIKNSQRFELITTDKNSSLKIDNVQREDRGEYHLKAINILGEDTASFLVTVTSRPKPPGKVELMMSFGKSATLSWTAPEDDGGCKIGNYIVEYFRIGWNVWLKASTTRHLTATLHDLIEGSEYKFRVKAENPYGLSDPSVESNVLFIPDPKRGISKPEDREPSPAPDKPIAPKRKTLSPLRNLLDASTVTENVSREPSPNRQSPTVKIAKPELYESEQLNREMCYGTPNDVVQGNQMKRNSVEKTTEHSTETRNSLSPGKSDEKTSAKSSPSLSRRGSFKLEVTQKIQQFFKRSPSPARRAMASSPKEQSPKSPTPDSKSTPKEQSPKQKSLSPSIIEKSPITAEEFPKQSEKRLSQEIDQRIQGKVVAERSRENIKSRSPSPFIIKKDPELASTIAAQSYSLKKDPELASTIAAQIYSPGLQRSQEPINFPENTPIRKFYNNNTSPMKEVPRPLEFLESTTANVNLTTIKPNLGNLSTPTIEISGPMNDEELPIPSNLPNLPNLPNLQKRDEVHTSNEFMLVLYPDKKSKNNQKHESFDLDLEDALSPPPISLSAPDLSDIDQYILSIQLRRSVSSTELLYERAMARFYEAVEMEEAEKSKKQFLNIDQTVGGGGPSVAFRKRLGSMSEAERLSFERRSNRRRSADISQEFTLPHRWDSKENISSLKSAQKIITEKIKHMESEEYSDEEEEEEEIISQQRQEQQQQPPPSKRGTLEYESDYTESTASDSIESMEKFKIELMNRTRSTSGELETYHPRRMSEGTFSPYRSPTPDQASLVLTKPVPLASPDFVPKPILKRPSNENVVKEDSGSDTRKGNGGSKPNSNENGNGNGNGKSGNNSKRSKKDTTNRTESKKEDKKSKGFKSFFKRDKNPDTDKQKVNSKSDGNIAKKSPIDITSSTSTGEAIQKNTSTTLSKRNSLEETERKRWENQKTAEEEAQVVIDHYSDIVKELGHTKKSNIPLYLNSEELRKAAEKADAEEMKLNIDKDIDDNEAELIARAIARPRMSIVERLQSKHVQVKSKSAMQPPNKTLIEKDQEMQFNESETQKSVVSSPSVLPSSTKIKTKIIKVKKVIKKRIPSSSAANSQDDLLDLDSKQLSEAPSSTTISHRNDIDESSAMKNTENVAPVRRRQVSKTRARGDSQSPGPLLNRRRLIKRDPTPDNQKQLQVDEILLAANNTTKNDITTDVNHQSDQQVVAVKTAEEIADLTEENVRSAISYITDLGLFIVACWVYLFKDVRLVLPILALMVYRQVGEAISNQIPDWMKRKKS